LLRTYQMPDFTELLSDEAETGALLRLIRETPQPRLPALVEKLSVEKKLSNHLLLMATREGLLDFLIATVSARTGVSFEQVKIDMLHGDATLVGRVLVKAGISNVMCEYFWRALIATRDKYEEPRKATG